MDVGVDHYKVLGLPSGEEGSKLSEQKISKAYRLKARDLHPDKRPDDPDAHASFQSLKSSYDILKDATARKLFDDLLRVKREREHRQTQSDSKRRRMVFDLEEREREAFSPYQFAKAQEEEDQIARKLRDEISRIRAMQANKLSPAASFPKNQCAEGKEASKPCDGGGLDMEKVLKASWEKCSGDYTAQKFRELFEKFGVVEDVLIKSSKKKGSALIVMASRDAAISARRSFCRDLSNPLLVSPLQPCSIMESEISSGFKSSDSNRLDKIVGAGHQEFEDSVLKKLQKAAAKTHK